MIELVSTVQIDGPRITLGAPVPEAERSPGWALMHLVTVNPEYAGRSRVMISNLEQTDDFDAACHNAFEKSGAQIQQQADAYLKAGNFATTSISGRALSMTRDFKPVQLGSEDARIAHGRPAACERPYGRSRHGLHELARSGSIGGLGADRASGPTRTIDAQTALQDAIDAGTKNARAWLRIGTLEIRRGRTQERPAS